MTTASAGVSWAQPPVFSGSATAGTEAVGPWEPNAPKMQFEVASVKRSGSGEQPDSNMPLGPGSVYTPAGGNFIGKAMPLSVYIMFAYKMSPATAQAMQKQAPGWVMTEPYDITAKTEKHDVTKDELRLMMRTLLADRFQLAIHSEVQQMSAYALVLASPGTLGPKLVPHAKSEPCDSNLSRQEEGAKPPPLTVAGGFPATCGGIMSLPNSTPGMITLGARDIPLGQLASVLTGIGNLGRPVQDQTGLKGNYDFVLELAPTRRPGQTDPANGPAEDSAGPELEQALRQQLGLKLESKKTGVAVWVVDHVERPTPN